MNLLVICHGRMAEGLVDAMRLIIGEQEGVGTVALQETDSIDELAGRVQAAIKDLDRGDGVLILVDLMGASPFNISARLAMENDRIEVVTGANLPMLLESAMQREGTSLRGLASIAKNAGIEAIVTLSEKMQSD